MIANPYEASQVMAQKRQQLLAAALRGQAPVEMQTPLPGPDNVILPTGSGPQMVGRTSGLDAFNKGIAPGIADLIRNYKSTPRGIPAAGAAGSFYDAVPGGRLA